MWLTLFSLGWEPSNLPFLEIDVLQQSKFRFRKVNSVDPDDTSSELKSVDPGESPLALQMSHLVLHCLF